MASRLEAAKAYRWNSGSRQSSSYLRYSGELGVGKGSATLSLQRLAEGHRTIDDRFIHGFSRPAGVPTESPQSGSAAMVPHRKPTDKTALPGTRRHG